MSLLSLDIQQDSGFAYYLLPIVLDVLFRQHAYSSLLRPSIAVIVGTGILTCWPSTTPFGFALGPD
jgi:hypothetical protein